MGVHRAESDIGRVLLNSPLVTSLSGRVIIIAGEPVMVDHLVASRAGGFLVEERSWLGSFAVEDGHLVRSRSGPGGLWAKGTEDARVDRVRRVAEAVDHLPAWLESLPQTTDQAGLAVLAARIDRAFHASDETRRIPAWKRDRQDDPPRRRQPVRPAPGPRAWTPHADAAGVEHSDPCARRGRSITTPTRVTPRYDASVAAGSRSRLGGPLVVAALAFGVLTVQNGGPRLGDTWDGVRAWATTVNRPDVSDRAEDAGELSAAEAQPPAPLPPFSQPVPLTSCQVLTAATMTRLLGQTVNQLPSSDPLACHFGPGHGDSTVVWVSVALGPDSENRTLSGVNGTHSWSPALGFRPTGPGGRPIATQVTVAMDAALYPSGSPGPTQLFQAVMGELVTGQASRPEV